MQPITILRKKLKTGELSCPDFNGEKITIIAIKKFTDLYILSYQVDDSTISNKDINTHIRNWIIVIFKLYGIPFIGMSVGRNTDNLTDNERMVHINNSFRELNFGRI